MKNEAKSMKCRTEEGYEALFMRIRNAKNAFYFKKVDFCYPNSAKIYTICDKNRKSFY